MAGDFAITGASEFRALAIALQKSGEKELLKGLRKGVREGVRPVVKQIRMSALESLPKAGGLNVVMAKSPSRIALKTGSRSAGVSVQFPKRQAGFLTGRIRHPVYGRVDADGARRPWVSQQVDGDWFDGTIETAGPVVRPKIEAAIEATLAEIVRRAKAG